MSDYDYDLFVIGAGSGGVRAARIAARHGANVAICEQSRVGGTCVIRGCIPKKLLSYAAHFSEDFEDASAYGWRLGEPEFSWPDLIRAKDREVDRLNKIYIRMLNEAGVTRMQGHGCLLDSHHVQVGDDKLSAERILIATGARPWVPDIPGAEHAITSDEAFHLEELPRHIAIVGGGYIAVEFASIFNGLGAEVDLLYRGEQILRGFDRDVRDTLAAEMGHKGVNVRLNTSVSTVERNADGFRLKLEDGEECRVDQLMYATGRVPNVMDLGVDAAGIEMHPGGWIPVDEYSRTNVPNIFAVGDVTHRIELTPVATHEGQAFAESEFGGRDRTIDHEFVPSAVFSQPPVATVGFAEHEAAEHYGELEVYRSHFRPLKHTLTGRNEHTMMKLVVQAATGRVVGLHVVGMDAPEIVQGFAIAVKFGMTKDQFDATIGIHPTAAEELVTMRRKVELATAVQG